jgi:hypothetical protein
MKRTEAQMICSPLFQLYKPAYHINDIEPAEYLLYGILGYHGHAM